jgi:hypothetical protein
LVIQQQRREQNFMPEEMIEDVTWESDGEDWESDDAIVEADDSAEDIGERTRNRRRRRYYRPRRGVQGIAVKSQDGTVRNVQFPTPLATAAETNRGLANQELARRALDERLNRLETRFQVQQKNDSSVSGLVSLLLGGGLVAYGAIEASKLQTGSFIGNWAQQNSTELGSVVSVSQIATSGFKFLINGGRNYRSGIGTAADIFAVAQIATFAIGSAFGSLYTPRSFQVVKNKDFAEAAMLSAGQGTLYLTQDENLVYEVELGMNGDHALRLVNFGPD